MEQKEQTQQVVEEVKQTTKKEQVKIDDKVVKLKVKKPAKKFSKTDEIVKVDLRKLPKAEETNANTEQETTDVVEDKQTEPLQEVVEEVSQEQTTVSNEEKPVIEELTEE